jgi:hypothetical protein
VDAFGPLGWFNLVTVDIDRLNPAIRSLWQHGFEAVPSLMRHLDDHRLARGVMTGFNMYQKHITRVGEIVSKILYAFAGEGEIKEQVNYNELELADRSSAEKWWVKAKAVSEEQYLLEHVMPSQNTERSWPNMHNAMLIAQRYPNRLSGIYEKLLREYPEVHTGVFAELMAKYKTQP